jgi:hypothetical protein
MTMNATTKHHGALVETARGRANDAAHFAPPTIACGADGARVTVYEVRTPNGATVGQFTAVGSDGQAVARLLHAALAGNDWTAI